MEMRDPSFPMKDSYTFLLFLIFLHWLPECTLAKILFEGAEQFLFFYNCSFSYVAISAWANAWLYSCHCPMFNREWCFYSIAPRRALLLITETFFGTVVRWHFIQWRKRNWFLHQWMGSCAFLILKVTSMMMKAWSLWVTITLSDDDC